MSRTVKQFGAESGNSSQISTASRPECTYARRKKASNRSKNEREECHERLSVEMKRMITLVSAVLILISAPRLFAQDRITASTGGTHALGGTWHLTWTGFMGQHRTASVRIRQDNTTLSGTFQGDHSFPLSGPFPIAGKVDGDKVTFSVSLSSGMSLTFTGTVAGDKMSGTTAQKKVWSAELKHNAPDANQ